MLACRIQKELQELGQGEKTVVEYVSELKRLGVILIPIIQLRWNVGNVLRNIVNRLKEGVLGTS